MYKLIRLLVYLSFFLVCVFVWFRVGSVCFCVLERGGGEIEGFFMCLFTGSVQWGLFLIGPCVEICVFFRVHIQSSVHVHHYALPVSDLPVSNPVPKHVFNQRLCFRFRRFLSQRLRAYSFAFLMYAFTLYPSCLHSPKSVE